MYKNRGKGRCMLFLWSAKVTMYKYYVRLYGTTIFYHTIGPNLLKTVPWISAHKTLSTALYTILSS